MEKLPDPISVDSLPVETTIVPVELVQQPPAPVQVAPWIESPPPIARPGPRVEVATVRAVADMAGGVPLCLPVKGTMTKSVDQITKWDPQSAASSTSTALKGRKVKVLMTPAVRHTAGSVPLCLPVTPRTRLKTPEISVSALEAIVVQITENNSVPTVAVPKAAVKLSRPGQAGSTLRSPSVTGGRRKLGSKHYQQKTPPKSPKSPKSPGVQKQAAAEKGHTVPANQSPPNDYGNNYWNAVPAFDVSDLIDDDSKTATKAEASNKASAIKQTERLDADLSRAEKAEEAAKVRLEQARQSRKPAARAKSPPARTQLGFGSSSATNRLPRAGEKNLNADDAETAVGAPMAQPAADVEQQATGQCGATDETPKEDADFVHFQEACEGKMNSWAQLVVELHAELVAVIDISKAIANVASVACTETAEQLWEEQQAVGNSLSCMSSLQQRQLQQLDMKHAIITEQLAGARAARGHLTKAQAAHSAGDCSVPLLSYLDW